MADSYMPQDHHETNPTAETAPGTTRRSMLKSMWVVPAIVAMGTLPTNAYANGGGRGGSGSGSGSYGGGMHGGMGSMAGSGGYSGGSGSHGGSGSYGGWD